MKDKRDGTQSNMLPKIASFFLLLFFVGIADGQITMLDSLKNKIVMASNESSKFSAIMDYCSHWESFNVDTLHRYALMADSMSANQNDISSKLYAQYYLTVWLLQENKLDTALKKIDALISKAKKNLPYGDIYIKLYRLRGNILSRGNKTNEMIASGFELLKMAEDKNDTSGMITASTALGNANFKVSNFEEAFLWHRKAIALMDNSYYKGKFCFVFMNIAVVFFNVRKFDSCEFYIKRTIQYAHEQEDWTDESNANSFYGVLLSQTGRVKEAEEVLKKSIDLQEKIGDNYYRIAAMNSLTEFYENTKQYQKAIDESLSALDLAKKIGSPYQEMVEIYDHLETVYYKSGDYKSASDIFKLNMEIRDSLYIQNPKEIIAELQTKYDLQKKENTIIQQKLDIAAKKNSIYAISFVSAILLLGLGFLYRYYTKLQKRQKENEAIAISTAEEAERKRISADLHDNIGAYAAAASSTISTIQPKDEKSGDTLIVLKENVQEMITQLNDSIWALNKKAIRLTAISDRFKLFVQKLEPAYPQITILIREVIEDDRLLSPFQALHLFRILQEALNNALRHSQCKNVNIQFQSDKKLLKIVIADDGIGMTVKNLNGNGLNNLKKRAMESGWYAEWIANESGGTSVVISSMGLIGNPEK